LELEQAIAPLDEAARREEFRISLLGRFKHGKSSVVNALLGETVSPVDLLPCTSTLIEFRYGPERAFRERRDGRSFEASGDDFAKSAGNAAAERGVTGERWHVELPIGWLGPGLVLVDTPGSDEDPERLELANQELERTDAALVVLRADQLFGLEDMELAEELQARLGCVIIVVNRIDRIAPAQRDRVMAHARRLAGSFGVPAERVLPLSATGALAGEPEFAAMLEELRRTISQVMLADVGGARLLSLLQRTRFLLDEIRPDMDRVVSLAQERLNLAERLSGSRGERLGTFQARRAPS
jgi:tRNA U34 5-carboxymethylaminomethyl modifying GTPase MnmE/TrmE